MNQKAPHIFHTFIAQARPPEPLRTQFLRSSSLAYLGEWTTTRVLTRVSPIGPFPKLPPARRRQFCERRSTQGAAVNWGGLGRAISALGYTIVLPGRKSGFRAGFRPYSNMENIKIGPLAGRRLAGGPILRLSLLESWPKSGPEAGVPALKFYCLT